jgi:2-polyprenyl-3-methyl-5-hydroxy-6-metoxy-1,4-benzoquinol methylase
MVVRAESRVTSLGLPELYNWCWTKKMSQDSAYRPEWVIAHYDDYGDREWERFSGSPVDAVSLFIHTHYLQKFVKPRSRVLDVGAGPGRFTQVLAQMGCRVTVADISPVQLELHRKYAQELGFEDAVEERLQLDVCDLSRFESESFDAVVCYGGPLSYVFDQAPTALRECVRVCKSGGHVLVSVMSLWGTAHRHLRGVLAVPPESNRKITETGDLSPENWEGSTHHCHMFRSGELRRLAGQRGLTVTALSASQSISTGWDDSLRAVQEDLQQWQELLRMELEACREEGCLDTGTHIILVGKKDRSRPTSP